MKLVCRFRSIVHIIQYCVYLKELLSNNVLIYIISSLPKPTLISPDLDAQRPNSNRQRPDSTIAILVASIARYTCWVSGNR